MSKIYRISLFFFFLFITRQIFAQAGVNVLPGLTCGMAGTGGVDQCCYTNANLNNVQLPVGVSLPPLQVTQTPCVYGEASTTDISDPHCKCVLKTTPTPMASLTKLCATYLKGNELTACNNCANGGGLWTGIGCVPLNLGSFVTDFLLNIGIGFAGIIALLCIIFASFRFQTSRGNPEAIKKAQEMLTSCIIGLMLIIFSVFILRLIGVDILRIPGFGK